jgi:SAM-dependent methyltransferase
MEQAGAFMVNLDVVSDSLEDLTAAGAQNCVCGDARRLPFRAEAFDVVFTKGSLHHSQPIAEPLAAMVGTVKRGGHIVIAEPNSYMFLPRFPLPGGLGYPTPYENALSRRQVARILAKNGVGELHFTALTYAPPGTPAPLANLWECVGQAMPRLFDRFAFEFILHGKRGNGVEQKESEGV